MNMIKANQLVYNYEKKNIEEAEPILTHALNKVDLDVKKGEFIAILGHNGSGKSTLAKHINGLLLPHEGTLYVKGMNTKNENDILEIRKSAGMVFQNPDNQIISTIVEEDVGFGPENMGVPTDEIWQRVEKSLSAVGMLPYRSHSPNKLSGGQKQRVAIAGVVAMEPDCIVLDEPTAMLDPVGRKEVLETVHTLNKEKNVTIILITHYMDEVIDADRIIVMDDGKIALQGKPGEIFSQIDTLKSLRLDVPQTVLLAHTLREQGLSLPDTILTPDGLVHALCQLKLKH